MRGPRRVPCSAITRAPDNGRETEDPGRAGLPDRQPCGRLPYQIRGPARAEQEVMCGGERPGAVIVSRGVDAEAVTHPGGDPGLVQGDPEPHALREGLVDDSSVLCEALARVPAGPAAQIFQRLR